MARVSVLVLETVATMKFSDSIKQLSLISTKGQSEGLVETIWVTYHRDPTEGIQVIGPVNYRKISLELQRPFLRT